MWPRCTSISFMATGLLGMRTLCPGVTITISFYCPYGRRRPTPTGDFDIGTPLVSSADALSPPDIFRICWSITSLNYFQDLAPISHSISSSCPPLKGIRYCLSSRRSPTFYWVSLSLCPLLWFTFLFSLTVHHRSSVL